MLEIAACKLSELVSEIHVLGPHTELGDSFGGVPVAQWCEPETGRGPLAALAMWWCTYGRELEQRYDAFVVLAVDYPFVSVTTLARLARGVGQGVDVFAPRSRTYDHPLCAAYSPSGMNTMVEAYRTSPRVLAVSSTPCR